MPITEQSLDAHPDGASHGPPDDMQKFFFATSCAFSISIAAAANAQDATLTVGERLGVSSRLIGTSYNYDSELFDELGVNTYFWGNSGPGFEGSNDTGCARGSGCWGSPSPADIKADVNAIPWTVWDEAVAARTDQLDHAKKNGITIVMGLRSHVSNSDEFWMANPPSSEGDWSEWWEHVFALGYALNVRQDWRVDHYQLENEPDRNDGYLGSIADYLEQTRRTHDALDYLYKTYLPGRKFYLAVPGDSWAGATDNPRMDVPAEVNGDVIEGSWLFDSIANTSASFNSVAVHAYGKSDGMAGWLKGQVSDRLKAANLDYPLWITEWGGDSTDGGRDIVDLLMIFARPESYVFAHHYFFTEQLKARDYKFNAMKFATRALRGAKPTFEVASSNADISALVTQETGGATYLLATNKSTQQVTVEADFGKLKTSAEPTKLLTFDGDNPAVEAVGPSVVNQRVELTIPPNGAVLLQLGESLNTPGGIDPGVDPNGGGVVGGGTGSNPGSGGQDGGAGTDGSGSDEDSLSNDGGCGCRQAGPTPANGFTGLLLLLAAGLVRRRATPHGSRLNSR